MTESILATTCDQMMNINSKRQISVKSSQLSVKPNPSQVSSKLKQLQAMSTLSQVDSKSSKTNHEMLQPHYSFSMYENRFSVTRVADRNILQNFCYIYRKLYL